MLLDGVVYPANFGSICCVLGYCIPICVLVMIVIVVSALLHFVHPCHAVVCSDVRVLQLCELGCCQVPSLAAIIEENGLDLYNCPLYRFAATCDAGDHPCLRDR